MLRRLHPLLKISQDETRFSRRGFACATPAIRERLEYVGQVFLRGYHAALEHHDPEELALVLNQTGVEHQGFAYEGAGMALALLDGITPWRKWRRFSAFISGSGQQHIYMLHVGAGWACARLPWLRRHIDSVIRNFHPVLGWLVIEGYGFHEGYFHWQTAFQPKISSLSPDARHVFYQGLGRSLWFVHGTEAPAISQTISSFAPKFRNDAWSGVGLACAYAGGMNRVQLEELLWLAGDYAGALAQGAAFAAGARQLAGNPVSHTNLACTVFCGMSAKEASSLCDQSLAQTTATNPCPFQDWRRMVQETAVVST